jgi:hypothetical protein
MSGSHGKIALSCTKLDLLCTPGRNVTIHIGIHCGIEYKDALLNDGGELLETY